MDERLKQLESLRRFVTSFVSENDSQKDPAVMEIYLGGIKAILHQLEKTNPD